MLAFEPPEAGDLPDEGKEILKKVYNICRSSEKYNKETPENKERCSKIAWNAVKKAGFVKENGVWKKIEAEIKDFSDDKTKEIFEKEDKNIEGANNIDDSIKAVSETGNEEKPSTSEEGMNMANEEKTETICAKKHEALMAEKDAIIAQRDNEISSLKTEIETLRATIKAFEDEKRIKILDVLKSEGVDTEKYKEESIPVLEKMVSLVATVKEKIKNAPETNSGAIVVAEEQKQDKTGEVITNKIETGKTETIDEEKINAILKRAREFYSANME